MWEIVVAITKLGWKKCSLDGCIDKGQNTGIIQIDKKVIKIIFSKQK